MHMLLYFLVTIQVSNLILLDFNVTHQHVRERKNPTPRTSAILFLTIIFQIQEDSNFNITRQFPE